MDQSISSYGNYTIGQLPEQNLYELASFVVSENYKHHVKERSDANFLSEIEIVYQEEIRYFNRSRIFVAKNSEDTIIGAIRLMNWDRKEVLPIQKLFNIQSLENISPADSEVAIWHIGRFAVSADIDRHGLYLFKMLLLYALYPICECEKGIVFAECDCKLLRTMQLMGIDVKNLGESIIYLGSGTTPVYATAEDLMFFFSKNQSLLYTQLNVSA